MEPFSILLFAFGKYPQQIAVVKIQCPEASHLFTGLPVSGHTVIFGFWRGFRQGAHRSGLFQNPPADAIQRVALSKVPGKPDKALLPRWSDGDILIFLLIYGLGIGVALSSRRNYRRSEEHGSAKWGSAAAVNKKYQAKDPEANKVFTKHVRMGLDGRKHRRNLNTVVVGGSGSSKSRFYALINLLQACSSYFVLDCKGELLRMTGTFLKMRGYEIKVLDLLSMEKSHYWKTVARSRGICHNKQKAGGRKRKCRKQKPSQLPREEPGRSWK